MGVECLGPCRRHGLPCIYSRRASAHVRGGAKRAPPQRSRARAPSHLRCGTNFAAPRVSSRHFHARSTSHPRRASSVARRRAAWRAPHAAVARRDNRLKSGPDEVVVASSSSAHSCPALVIRAYVSFCLQRQSASCTFEYMRYIYPKVVCAWWDCRTGCLFSPRRAIRSLSLC
jgi:hypothetical protein